MRIAIVASSLVVFVSGCGTKTPGSPLSDADTAAIHQTYRAMTAAGLTNEYKHLGRFFTADAVWMPPDAPAVQGRAAVEAWFTVRALQWDVRILEIDGRGDLAYTRS